MNDNNSLAHTDIVSQLSSLCIGNISQRFSSVTYLILHASCLNNIVFHACIIVSIVRICFTYGIKKLVEVFLAVYAAEKRLTDYVSVFIDHICGRKRHYSE